MKRIYLIILVFYFAIFIALANSSTCVDCHKGIEKTSEFHDFQCIECHGGNNTSNDKEEAHSNMIGGRNPSDPLVWDKTCGSCHQYQLERVKTTIMFTNTGIIKNTQKAWDEFSGNLYSTFATKGFDAKGKPISILPVSDGTDIASELYRKFCSLCHVGYDRMDGYRAHHSAGCAACHYSHDDSGKYLGGDEQLKGKFPYPKTHKMNALPGDDVCFRCHNRSGRISLSYEGKYDGNNSLVPTNGIYPGPEIISGVRNVRHTAADIHKQKGMECIDCHTSRELMGDGYIYENMYNQIEISCESCHGTENELPKTEKITKENASPLYESLYYKKQIPYGTEMVLTDKGNMFSNVFKENGKYYLMLKRSGKILELTTIKDTKEHKVYGHERLECYSCHSKMVIQCYGCHTIYDKREMGMDWIKGEETKGLFSEKEDIRLYYPFPLAVNQRGKISPVTPGCQTFFTVIEEDGSLSKDNYLFNFKNGKNFKFAPFYGHNTGEKAVGCRECHMDLFFAGFGEAIVSTKKQNITSPLLCLNCDKPLTALYDIVNGNLRKFSQIVRDESKLLDEKIIKSVIRANLCITCHDKADNDIYGEKIEYEKILNDRIHKPLINTDHN
jgi:hypothetical protein